MDRSIQVSGRAGRVALGLSMALAATAATAGTYEVIHVFTNEETGHSPSALTVDAQGNIYGVAQYGGVVSNGGTLFKVTATGTTVLHSFGQGADGQTPVGAPLVGSDGFIYGTTSFGGSRTWGTVYRIDTSGGNYQFLSMTNGREVLAGLVEDGAGNFYGVASNDVRNDTLTPGTVFKTSFASQTIQPIHRFHGFDGKSPRGRLAWLDGRLIGTAYEGGIDNRGVTFSINPDGTDFRVKRLQKGARQTAGMTVDRDGRVWGLTQADKAFGDLGNGGIYQLGIRGKAGIALRFTEEIGTDNESALTLASDGLLYNAAPGDAFCACGTIYRFDPATGSVEVLYRFLDYETGYLPRGGVVEASPGVFYGVAYGGPAGLGVVYRFTL